MDTNEPFRFSFDMVARTGLSTKAVSYTHLDVYKRQTPSTNYRKEGHEMPCPHNQISIVQRSNRQSAVAAAAYQSGEKPVSYTHLDVYKRQA